MTDTNTGIDVPDGPLAPEAIAGLSPKWAIDVVYAWADRVYLTGKDDAIEETMRNLDLSGTEASVILSLLIVTDWARDRLQGRQAFVERCLLRLQEIADRDGRPPGYVMELTTGLR